MKAFTLSRGKESDKVLMASTIALGAIVFSANGYAAGTDTSNLSVTAEVVANCTISTSAVAFGNYDPIVANASANLDASGAVTITCTNGAAAAIALGQGANAGAASTDADPVRRMTDGTNFLDYTLFSDSGRTTEWGNDTTTDVDRTGTGNPDAVPVYGRILAGQNAPVGSYTDTVVATVTF